MHAKIDWLAAIVGVVLVGVGLLGPCAGFASSLQPAHAAAQPLLLNSRSSCPLTVVEGVLRNRTLYDALTACNIPASEIISLSRSFKSVFDFRSSRPKDAFQVCVDDQYLIQKFVYKTSPLDEYEAVKEEDGGYTVVKRDIVLDRELVAKAFIIETSLVKAVVDSGESQQLAGMIADIFAWDIDFYLFPRKGDRVVVVYERCYKDDEFLQYGDILAARYEGQNKTFSAFLFNDGQFDGYYDESGQPLKKMFRLTPIKFGKMTSGYSIRRFHPVSKRYKAHTGIDYGAPRGTPVMATANGRVTFAGWKGGYGKLLIVKHANGYETYYGHCSRLLKKRGQLVEQGEVIARVGSTGVATGPHVHYEVRVNGKPIDPNRVRQKPGRPLAPELLAAFKQTVEDYLIRVATLEEGKTSLVLLSDED